MTTEEVHRPDNERLGPYSVRYGSPCGNNQGNFTLYTCPGTATLRVQPPNHHTALRLRRPLCSVATLRQRNRRCHDGPDAAAGRVLPHRERGTAHGRWP